MSICRTRTLQSWLAALSFLAVCLFNPSFNASAQTPDPSVTTNAPRFPNIIFILADDLGYGDLGCYGQTKIKTPNLDQLAAEGMRFTSFYAGNTVCAPSRASLLTGFDSGHSPIRGNDAFPIPLPADGTTLATVLHHAGYATDAVGKWGLGEKGSSGVPVRQGFDEWFGFLNQVAAHNYFPESLNRANKDSDREIPIIANQDGKSGKYVADYFTESALNLIRLNTPDWFNHYRPFFLYLAYTIPHANNELAAGAGHGNGMQVPNDAPYSAESWPAPEKNKAAMITRLDSYAGMVRQYLHKNDVDKNTIIIFASDNGAHREGGVDPKFFQSNGPLRGIKRDLYEGGIRVPFIVWWPGKVKAGSTSDAPFAFWDVLPTFARIARQPVPDAIQGISFLPTLLGEPQAQQHEFLYWEFHESGFKQAVRMGDWKAVRFGVDGPLELYNLKTDLAEKTNVAAAHPDLVAQIETFLKTARTEDKAWPTDTAAHTPKKEYSELADPFK